MARRFVRSLALPVVLAAIGLSAVHTAEAGDRSTPLKADGQYPHVRTTDPLIRNLLKTGAARSAGMRQLLADLDASDVVAYVTVDRTVPRSPAARTWFVAAGGNTRYVESLIRDTEDALEAIVLIAHELAHALEVARDPAIIDPQSMAERFLTFGTVRIRGGRLYVETDFARRVEQQVRRDLTPYLADLAAAARD